MQIYVDWVVLIVCAAIVVLWACAFPYPSLLIRRFLPPSKRWPEAQIRSWLGNRRYNKSYLRFFYRDPERYPPVEPGFVSPADGVVASLECKNGIRYIVIALSFWDVHIQRCPEAGIITDVTQSGSAYMDGEGRSFAFLMAKPRPVQIRVTMQTVRGQIAVRLITSLAARRLEALVNQGEKVTRGQRLGRILLGSTVVLELPQAWPVQIKPGERVIAGETLVAGGDRR